MYGDNKTINDAPNSPLREAGSGWTSGPAGNRGTRGNRRNRGTRHPRLTRGTTPEEQDTQNSGRGWSGVWPQSCSARGSERKLLGSFTRSPTLPADSPAAAEAVGCRPASSGSVDGKLQAQLTEAGRTRPRAGTAAFIATAAGREIPAGELLSAPTFPLTHHADNLAHPGQDSLSAFSWGRLPSVTQARRGQCRCSHVARPS